MPGSRRRSFLEQERQHIRQEAEAEKELARADGYRQGYGEGLRQARVEGRGPDRRASETGGRAYPQLSGAGGGSAGFAAGQAQNELCELSLAVAEKVIHISLRTSRDVIARMIQVATEKLKRREWVHIYVGGDMRPGIWPRSPQSLPQRCRALRAYQDHPYVR